MKFSDIDHGFCESVGQTLPYPEIYNSYSSLFISLVGLVGLFISLEYKRIYNIKIIYGILVVNGIGSFYYHYTQQMGWAVVDELSMMISIILGAHTLYLMIVNSKNLPILYGVKKTYIHNHYFYKGLLTLISSFYLIFSYTLSIFSDTRYLFPVLFAIPAFLLIPGLIYIYSKYYGEQRLYNPRGEGRGLFLGGMSLSLISATIWIISENLCIHYHWIKYLHAHVMWHIGISYGMFLLISFMLHFHIFINDGKFCEVKYIIGVPIFSLKSKKIDY